MRIAFLSTQWPGVRLGGIGAYTQHAARALAAAGHEVHVFTFTLPRDADRALGRGAFLHEVPSVAQQLARPDAGRHLRRAISAGGEPAYHLAMGRCLAEALLDVHARTPFDIAEGPEYEALTLPLCERAPASLRIVTHLHSGSAIAFASGNTHLTREHLDHELLELAAIRASDACCAPSRAVVDDTAAAYGQPIQAQVVPLPFDPSPFGDEFSPPAPGAPILFLGRLELLKGAHLVTHAANQFLPRYPAATIRIAGPDSATAPDEFGQSTHSSMRRWMESHITPELRDRIQFPGELDRPAIARELRQCSFVVIPSLFESYSYVCCEALAAGRPVVVSDRIGATEVAGPAGLPFTRGDAHDLAVKLEHLWGNEALLARLATLAWDRARRQLSSEVTIRRRIAFYENLLKGEALSVDDRVGRIQSVNPQTFVLRKTEASPQEGHGHLEHAERVLGRSSVTSANSAVPITPVMRLLQALTSASSGPSRFHLYGAGRHTLRLLAEQYLWKDRGHELIAIIDDHPRYAAGGEFEGFPVLPMERALRVLSASDTVILSSDAFEEQLWDKAAPLRAKNIRVLRLYAG